MGDASMNYLMVISMIVSGHIKPIEMEYYTDLHQCNIAGHIKEVEYGSKGIYNVIIECRKVNNETNT
jgi:hypothetical protein